VKKLIRVTTIMIISSECPYDGAHYPNMSLEEVAESERNRDRGDKIERFIEEIQFAEPTIYTDVEVIEQNEKVALTLDSLSDAARSGGHNSSAEPPREIPFLKNSPPPEINPNAWSNPDGI
jgi:hypothetical protein